SAPPRQYFVLTDAGKPVFVSDASPLTGDQDALASTMGLMQALVSVFLDDGDKLRCINAGRTRICFLLRSPLYYVCASNWGEPESVIRSHLEYLHLQILSVVSGAQLRRIFERRANFDLRRLLSGAETFLHMLLTRMQTDLAMSTSSLLCLPLDPSLRRKVGEALIPSKMKDILYVMLIARGRVVTLVRPKKHSVHPADLHILLNTIHAPAIVEAPASWLPVCLPKFNPSGFLHAYVSFPRHGEFAPSPPPGGGGGEFEAIRAWCASATQALESSGTLSAIERAVRRGHTEYGVHALDVPGLRHFVYKSRAHVQVTHPLWGDEYADGEAQRRLITLYQTLHDAIHGKSGQRETLKLQYIRTERESVMGWITQPFELYISMSHSLSKATVVSAANAVVRWVKREEAKLFLRDAPVF
ncbi:vacuolar fusion protein MON1, partial [Phellopilus nigrolimitatus]